MWLFRRNRKAVPLPDGMETAQHFQNEAPALSPVGTVAPKHYSNFEQQTWAGPAFLEEEPLPSSDQRKTKPKRRFTWKFRLFFIAPLIALCSAGVTFACMLVYYTMIFPDPLSLQHKERAPVIRILARDGSVLAQRGAAHDYMPLNMLPKHVIDAVVATEDRRFFHHWGVDPSGLIRAFFANLRAGRVVQGGSTLTQQLAKNLFLSRERTLKRKFEEFVLATWLEVRLRKQDILELYLNRVYFGGGTYGIEAASQKYFDKSARGLSLAEAAIIAGLLKAPSRYSPSSSPSLARRRGRVVLRKMLRAGVITRKKFDQAIAKQVRFAQHKHNDRQSSAAYAVDYILARMPSLITGNHREIVVETTLDGELQKFSTRKIRKVLTGKARALRANQAALVLMDVDGAVRAMVGGRSHSESQFNRAVKARRQPGSAFKPFVYLAALESGMTPDSTNYDLPVKVAGWSPRNGSGNYEGAVTLRYALAKSINTVAVRLNLDLGPDRVAATAARLGIKSSLRQEPSLALGTSEVNLFELTNAYATFANGGNAVQPFMVRRVRTNTGRVLYATANSEPEQLIAPKHVGAMNDMLNAALVTGTGRRAGLMRHPVAGKTGTSQQFRDAWFIGYSAHMTAGVWIGNDNGRTMDKVMGGSLPAEIWHAVMSKAHEAKAPIALPGTLPVSARVSSSPRRLRSVERRKIKRSVKAREALPWLSKKQNAEKRVAPSLLKAGRNSPKRRQAQVPRHRISEDFIARVLSQSDGLIQAKVDDPNATDAIAAQLETQPRNGRRQRPPGMMTLGAR